MLVEDFEKFWHAEQRAASEELREPSLPRAIWRRHGGRYAIYSLLMVVWCVAQFAYHRYVTPDLDHTGP